MAKYEECSSSFIVIQLQDLVFLRLPHGGGGGGLTWYSGGTAENMIFLSMPFRVPLVERDTSAATKPAFPAKVGSV